MKTRRSGGQWGMEAATGVAARAVQEAQRQGMSLCDAGASNNCGMNCLVGRYDALAHLVEVTSGLLNAWGRLAHLAVLRV